MHHIKRALMYTSYRCKPLNMEFMVSCAALLLLLLLPPPSHARKKSFYCCEWVRIVVF